MMRAEMGKRAITYFWVAAFLVVESCLAGIWNAGGHYSDPVHAFLNELPLTWWYDLLLEWVPFLLIFSLSFGRWNVDVYGEKEQREQTRGGWFRRGCILCMVEQVGVSCINAGIILVRGGWWGVLFPVVKAVTMWALYRALYPKQVPAGPESE